MAENHYSPMIGKSNPAIGGDGPKYARNDAGGSGLTGNSGAAL
jgi:hypothetical protein